tara:strand:- start:33901 stop:35988 length:2088 start_codon:yes stop_codon:yes gene_type:complete
LNFLIADTFPAALRKLTAQEQKAVKTTVFDLQMDPAHPALSFHRIDKSKDQNFWSIRASRDIRLIIHKTADSILVCYVDHHDDAYKWAERRRIDTHPRTGAAQIVEVRERVEEILVHVPVEADATPAPHKPPLFAHLSTDDLLDYGVPEDWLESVLEATEDTLFELAEHLPAEAAEALLDIAVGEKPKVRATPVAAAADAFYHPDAQRRFRVLENEEELRRALDYPWDQWTVFLHPSQRDTVERVFNGPARVSGSAGTGKTVVALHRTWETIKREPDAKVLLTTFSPPLANALEKKLQILTGDTPEIVHRVSILPFKGVAKELFTLAFGHDPRPAKDEQVKSVLKAAADKLDVTTYSVNFLMSEWTKVVDAWQVSSLDDYRNVPRLGRKNRLGSKQRETLWPIFEKARSILETQGIQTWPEIYKRVTEHFNARDHKPYTHVVVDEAQDLSVPELRMLAAIVSPTPDAMFFAGDLGQRIFQEPFSWLQLGVDIRGRSGTLKVNYRTSHQIRQSADQLLPPKVRDVDGEEQDRTGTVSVFNGPEPTLKTFANETEEVEAVSTWIQRTIEDGIEPSEIGVFVRSLSDFNRARKAVQQSNNTAMELSERQEDPNGRISIGTMHLAKGLEFKAVAVMACDDDVLPLQSRIDGVADEAELTDVFETERHLFYVACTRARDRLFVSGVSPGSEFLDDLGQLS